MCDAYEGISHLIDVFVTGFIAGEGNDDLSVAHGDDRDEESEKNSFVHLDSWDFKSD